MKKFIVLFAFVMVFGSASALATGEGPVGCDAPNSGLSVSKPLISAVPDKSGSKLPAPTSTVALPANN
ncbi:MAG: hypothetical protein ACXWP5_10085 [Bdellovibrionota bacterium]